MRQRTITVDVREDLRNGRPPFARIMAAADALQQEDVLRLVSPFEPMPLYAAMEQRGFCHEAAQTGSGDWEVLFSRANSPSQGAGASAEPNEALCRCALSDIVEVDARGLEPPQPMVTILEALASLPAGGRLRARTDRRPMHLYAQLEARGFAWETQPASDGTFATEIWASQPQ
jgi:uncharacterized protein (DUF2249 family)